MTLGDLKWYLEGSLLKTCTYLDHHEWSKRTRSWANYAELMRIFGIGESDRKNNLALARLQTLTIEHVRSGHAICSGDLNSHYPKYFFPKCAQWMCRQSEIFSLMAPGGWRWDRKNLKGAAEASPLPGIAYRDKHFPAISNIFKSFSVHA